MITLFILAFFSFEPIDVVIPSCEKDLITLDLCIEGIKKNGENINRVIVVSDKQLTKKAEWFDEKNYPFSKQEIKSLLPWAKNIGWYYQQLLKFYAPFVIPDISPNVLVLDSDTIFLKKTAFQNSLGGPVFSHGKYHWNPYFLHMDKLMGGQIKKVQADISGISHHMLFQKPLLDLLFQEVEALHQEPFWLAFCHSTERLQNNASEYEIYFNYALTKSNDCTIRKLNAKNIYSLKEIDSCIEADFDIVSCHSYSRNYSKKRKNNRLKRAD